MYKDRIDAYIDSKKEEMLNDLKTLVCINSQKGSASEGKPFGEGPAEVLAKACELMHRYGLQVSNYDNYVVTGDFSDQPKKLDVLAHLDVVPVTDCWTVTQPFKPKIVDGCIYGRGTADDKGPAIAALYALRAIKDLEIPMKHSVRLILGSDEECGSNDLKHYYSLEKEADYSFTPDADFPVINIEKGRMEGHFSASFTDRLQIPSILSFQSGDKANVVPQKAVFTVSGITKEVVEEAARELGSQLPAVFLVEELAESLLRVETRGKAAHASTPGEGCNALTAALRLIRRLPLAESEGLKALYALDTVFPFEDTCGKAAGIYREEETSGPVTLCFSILDYTPENMTGTFDARLPIGCNEENTKKPIMEKLASYRIILADEPMVRPHCVPGDSEFVKILMGSYERYTGIKGKPLSTGGGTYVHELERGVAFGCMTPEVDNHMHGDDEFMVIDTLLTSAKIFADAILKICNTL